jgi:hypothetical protein
MKRTTPILSAIVAAALYAVPAAAQVGWVGGATAGVSSAKVSGDIALDSSSRTGLLAGLSIAYQFTGYSSIVLEGNWAAYGGKDVRLGGNTPVDGMVDLNLSYVEFPLLLNAFRPVGDRARIGFSFGVAAGLRISCTAESASAGKEDCEDSGLGANASTATFSVPAGLAVGYELQNGSIVMLDARYALGISGLFEEPLNGIKSRAVQITAKWSFPLRR